MSKLAICPAYVRGCEPNEVADVLLKVTQSSNSTKLVVDEGLRIIERYKKSDPLDLVNSWINFIANEKLGCLHKVKLALDPDGLDDYDLTLNLVKEVSVDRRMLTNDFSDYSHLKLAISSLSVDLFDRSNAHAAFHWTPPFSYEALTRDILAAAHRMTKRFATHAVEDIHNDVLGDLLAIRDYNVADQMRSGSSASGKSAGEVDLSIRSNGNTIESIIEALRLASCGVDNSTVAAHMSKLINKYDSSGVARSFIVVYAESQNFHDLWANYKDYVANINSKADFDASRYPLSGFLDLSEDYGCHTNVRVGRGTHKRSPYGLEVIHVFINVLGVTK